MNAAPRIAGVAALIASLGAIFTAPAQASESIESFSSTLSTTLVGGHPDIKTSFRLAEPGVKEAARNVSFEAPQGIFGNPRAIDVCTSLDFALTECPPSSQAGLITLRANFEGNPDYLLGTAPLYDLDPGEAQPARFGFIVPTLGIPITIPVTVRTATDYGLRFTVANITQQTPLAEAQMTFWGFPSDPGHDVQRFAKGAPGSAAGCPGEVGTGCIAEPSIAAIPVHPLTDNPTVCTGQPLPVRLVVQTYQDPSHPSQAEATYPPITECETETFQPVFFAAPTTTETDSASGLDINLSNPQALNRATTPSELRAATVTLPEGLTINPDAADGQRACTDVEANFGSEGPANCPDNAKIGTVAIHSVALEGSLLGSIYIGEPKTGDQYRLFLIADGFGIHAKLVGAFRPDPQTGQVKAYFQDLPQVPFDEFDVHLFASDRGLVATPTTCRLYESVAEFYPWNAVLPEVESSQIFGLQSGPNGTSCPGLARPFAPRLAAGTSNSASGAYSNFELQLDRDDGDQFLGDLNFTMPPGLTANLRGITYCPEGDIVAAAQNAGRAEQANASCPLSSQIGTTNVAAGPGAHPFHAIGRMYLGGPFKGAPLSLVAVTPAVAGPYDYGTQVVRVAIHIDPLDAHVRALSDTVPQIIGGIPLRLRSIRVNIDRPNFMLNPTNCAPLSVNSQGIGDQGTVTDFSSYFRVVNCERLGFRPTMKVRQVGRKSTRRATNPKLVFDLKTRPGDANIHSLAVTLPNAFEIDQRHLGNICSEKELATTQCAGRTPIGTASTATPLLDQPLSGPVYAVSGSGGLPRVAFILNGQVDIAPRADTKTVGGKLKTTVPVVPDAPIGHFVFSLSGGKTGYLINTSDICANRPVVHIDYIAQNGKTLSQKAPVKTACGGKSAGHRGRHGR
jgi:hypothetical protein